MRFLIAFALLGCALTSEEAFYGFTTKFAKNYRNAGEMMKKKAIFTESYNKMIEHESCTAISLGKLANDLSEQHILDCAYNHVVNDNSGSWGAYGCDGAWPQAYYDWVTGSSSYFQEESAYPYTSGRTGDVGACRPSSNGYNTDFKLTGMWNQWFTNENDMEGLVAMNP